MGTHGPVQGSNALPMPPLFPGEAPTEDHSALIGSYNPAVPQGFQYGQSHGAKWGRQIAETKDTIEGWVREHQPNYLLVMLGFNDLGWFVSGPEDAVGNMGQLIENARRGKPDIKILVGNIIHRTFIPGRQDLVDNTNYYNQLLRQNIESWWFRWESPLVYVDLNSAYNCRPHDGCPDAYDGLHPNTMGEYHIAQAFARSLRQHFGFISPEFEVPANPEGRPVTEPTNVGAVSFPQGIRTYWDMVPNARGYDIRARLQGMTGWWSEGPVSPNSYASWNTWVLNGQTWETQVRTRGDGNDVSGWSNIAATTANVQTSPGPPNIISNPVGGDGIHISWSAVSGYSVNRYGVIIWDKDTPGAFIESRPTTGTSMTITGLKNGHRYGTWVATYVNLEGKPAGGLPASGRDVFVGRGAPAVPGNVRIVNLDPTSVRINWDAVGSASGYAVYIYTIATGAPYGDGALVTGTEHGIGFLFPGTWNYRYCVTAYNGNLETSRTAACVVPPKYPGFKARDVEGAVGSGNRNGTHFPNGTTGAGAGQASPPPYDAKSMVEDKSLQMLLKQMMIQEAAIAENDTIAALPEQVFLSEEVF